ncbi:MAG: ATP-binding protein [Candidatus Aminicenantes bacterium]|nr:ATP-binding protein [Candidatus Aminicenantes bacterium]
MTKQKNETFKEVPVEQLKWRCDPETLGFKTIHDITACPDIIGQPRAVNALRLGLDIDSQGYNLFVNGQPGTGRKTAINCLLKETDRINRIPDDKIYVNNFKNPDMPTLIRLKAGDGRKFKKAMEQFVDHLLKHIPAVYDSENYQGRRKEKVETLKAKQKESIKHFEEEAAKENFALVQMQIGAMVRPVLLPLVEGKPVNFDRIKELETEGKLSKGDLEKMEKTQSTLMDQLEKVFEELKDQEKAATEQLKTLDREMINPVIDEHIDEIKKCYKCADIDKYLEEVKESVQEGPERFSRLAEDKEAAPKGRPGEEGDPFTEYRVNLLVDNDDAKQAPVIFETSPSYSNLFGTVEITLDRPGGARTDFTKIKAGSFLKADGGFLIVEALDMLVEPGVWPAFKRALKNRQMEIQIYAPVYMVSISAMKPQPIACDVKVAIVGDPELYQLLYHQDPDFKKIFKLRADFDSVMDVKPETIMDYANFMKRIVTWEKLLSLDNKAVAAVVEYGVRLAGKQKKLSTQFNRVADVLREANYWALKDKKKMITDKYIHKAIEEKNQRSALVEEKIQEMIAEGSIMIATEGGEVGQVNGLAVYDMGDYMFGKPSRITANVSVGDAGVINIEREAQMSGPTHNKGVLILSGYLRAQYAQDKPLAMSASLCFEQSYSGVDGDSASSTEIYALLSALSGLPLRQDIAVTGSVNQKGEIQPIGGVNEKIEGFFAVCSAMGLTGSQGVMIPHQNVGDLMLKDEVIAAVKQGKFHIYPVKLIDRGIEILTGVPAGARQEDGSYPEGTVNYHVDEKLRSFGEKWKQYKMGK